MNRQEIGLNWENKAIEILKLNNYKIEIPNPYSVFDLIAHKKDETLGVNVKSGDRVFGIQLSNLRKIIDKNGYQPSYLFINENICVLFVLKKIFYKKNIEIPKVAINVVCKKCHHYWKTKGKYSYVSCPSCLSKVKIK